MKREMPMTFCWRCFRSKENCKKGRILIEETVLEGYPEEVQTRIKIDRFTGGVIESALLETKEVWVF
ncbi:MAG: hypothetical protein ACPLZA_06345 [Thermodesulfovibrio sp.]